MNRKGTGKCFLYSGRSLGNKERQSENKENPLSHYIVIGNRKDDDDDDDNDDNDDDNDDDDDDDNDDDDADNDADRDGVKKGKVKIAQSYEYENIRTRQKGRR